MQDTNLNPKNLTELIEKICNNTTDIKHFLSSRGLKTNSVEAILVPDSVNSYRLLDESDVPKFTTEVSPDRYSQGRIIGITYDFALWRDFIVYTKNLIFFRYENEEYEYGIVLPRQNIPNLINIKRKKWRNLIQLEPKS